MAVPVPTKLRKGQPYSKPRIDMLFFFSFFFFYHRGGSKACFWQGDKK